MNIRTKFRIGTTVMTVFAILCAILMLIFVFLLRNAYQKQTVAESIAQHTLQLSLIRNDWIKSPSQEAKALWNDQYRTTESFLNRNARLFQHSPEKELFTNIQSQLIDSNYLFEQLVEAKEQNGDTALIEQLTVQMSEKSRGRIVGALELMEISRDEANRTGQTFAFIIVLLAIALLVTSAAIYAVNAKIFRSIQVLDRGTRIISAGDLSHRLDIRSNDELGHLAKAFNEMVFRLQNHTANLKAEVDKATQDLRERQNELLESNAFLDAIIENIPNMIFLKDAEELRFVRFNRAGEELLGYNRKDLLGKNDYDFFPEDQADFFTQKDKKVLHDGTLVDIPEEPIDTKTGKRFLHTKKIPIRDADGKPQYLLGISEDITERIRSDTSKTEFVSLASHQLRTPLSAIRLTLRTLLKKLKGPLSDEQGELVAEAEKMAIGMSETINALLSVSLAEEKKIALNPEVIVLSDLFASVVTPLENVIKEKNIRYSVHCEETLSLHTDKALLTEILGNLVGNAVRYTKNGGTIGILARTEEDRMRIDIRDTGIGISEDAQKKLFTKFFRADNAMTMLTDGTGLGLYLAHSFVILLGGSISVKSAEHEGSTFTIRLPYTLHKA